MPLEYGSEEEYALPVWGVILRSVESREERVRDQLLDEEDASWLDTVSCIPVFPLAVRDLITPQLTDQSFVEIDEGCERDALRETECFARGELCSVFWKSVVQKLGAAFHWAVAVSEQVSASRDRGNPLPVDAPTDSARVRVPEPPPRPNTAPGWVCHMPAHPRPPPIRPASARSVRSAPTAAYTRHRHGDSEQLWGHEDGSKPEVAAPRYNVERLALISPERPRCAPQCGRAPRPLPPAVPVAVGLYGGAPGGYDANWSPVPRDPFSRAAHGGEMTEHVQRAMNEPLVAQRAANERLAEPMGPVEQLIDSKPTTPASLCARRTDTASVDRAEAVVSDTGGCEQVGQVAAPSNTLKTCEQREESAALQQSPQQVRDSFSQGVGCKAEGGYNWSLEEEEQLVFLRLMAVERRCILRSEEAERRALGRDFA